jgi:hypothetical protein
MSAIDPQEFGDLRAQVRQLVEADREKTEMMRALSENVTAMRLQMAEARGGWKVLAAIGGASATAGGALSWVLTHFTGRGPS